MTNKKLELSSELPSKARLIKSTIVAILAAAVILLTVVLPAEYGIDPTGAGEFIGLLKMGEIKVSLAEEAATDRASDKTKLLESNISSELATKLIVEKNETISNEMKVNLEPNEGKEIKLTMKKGKKVEFIWFTDGGKANFDAHADSKILKISYHSYGKGSKERDEGVLEAAFDGNHGWFWRNRTSKPMIVTLQVNGDYSDIKLIK